MADLRTSQESLSSRSTTSNESWEDEKSIYENLMEIFPLMEDFINKQGTIKRSAFGHQAPMNFTRAPSRQVPQKRKMEPKALEIPDQPKVKDLQKDLDEVSNRLKETQLQSTSVTKKLESSLEAKETHIVEMELMVRRLQKDVQRREEVMGSAQKELAQRKDEIARMRFVMERAESNISLTNSKAVNFEQELVSVQMELSAVHSQLIANERSLSESPLNLCDSCTADSVGQGQSERDGMEVFRRNMEVMELARRAYLAAVIVARQSHQESALVLCAVLRFQLEALLRQTDVFVDSRG